MKLSKLQELPATREMIDVFKGYNHNLRIGDGEFYNMKNLTSEYYPLLSPRAKRGIYLEDDSTKIWNGLISKDSLCYVEGEYLYINKKKFENLKLDNTKKTLISMGAYIIIMPDKKYINTENDNDYGNIEADFTSTVDVEFFMSTLDGAELVNPVIKDEFGNPIYVRAGKTPQNAYGDMTFPSGMLWIDTSDDKQHELKIYDAVRATWTAVATTYITISTSNIGKNFSVGDGVKISGVLDSSLQDLNSTMIIRAKTDNSITVVGMLSKVVIQSAKKVEKLEDGTEKETPTPIKVERRMPKMDFIIESGNRLWGCRYGPDNDGNIVNEIYASKLGDFKNWHCLGDGISTDSYVASVGTDGQFTGAITYMGYPHFFKENCLHKVYGYYPANYQIQTTACRGVQKFCSKSLAIVNETLFYKSRSGICAYDGALPVEISSILGDIVYDNAVAGSLGNKYYVSMREPNRELQPYHLFVYDTVKGMWHREDNTQAEEFCNNRGNLYYIDRGTNQIMTVKPLSSTEGNAVSSAVEWSAETGIIGTDTPDKKYISRIVVRLSLEVGTRVMFFVDYDSSGVWEYLFSMDGTSLKTFSIPIRPKRCDHLRLRIEGEGEAKIFSIAKTIEQGSDA